MLTFDTNSALYDNESDTDLFSMRLLFYEPVQ